MLTLTTWDSPVQRSIPLFFNGYRVFWGTLRSYYYYSFLMAEHGQNSIQFNYIHQPSLIDLVL